jgi:hypothetical protein
MSLRLLKSLFGTDAQPRTRTLAARLNVQSLEGREVPATLNLTTAGSSGVINGAIFQQVDTPSSDPLLPFVRIDADGVEQGYNTDARPLQYDERPNRSVTRSLLLTDVPLVNIGGVNYREFVLDINQTRANPRLSLDELRIFLGDTGDLSGYRPRTDTLAGQTAVYDLDASDNNRVVLNANLNRGGTSGDMRLYVPDQLFVGGSYVYLYSKFGQRHAANGGVEEWSVRPVTSPPPTLGSISGVLFEDIIANGVPDPDEALSGLTVFIDVPDEFGVYNGELDATDLNENGVWDEGEGERWTITDENGFYTFSGLAAGNYRVATFSQEGYDVFMTEFFDVTLLAGENRMGVNFRFVIGG